ncbi:MAG: hypothetical protein ACLQIB_13945 [Isosphaeraceae bacterium]
MRKRLRLRSRPVLDQLDDRCLLSGLTPSQLTTAYGLDAISFTSSPGSTVKGDGTGETIALIEAYSDPNVASDLHTFDVRYNLPDPKLTVIDQAGSQTNSGWASEEALDVEWAHAIAPGANIVVVEARSQSITDLLKAVNTARSTAGVVAISMSWGFPESSAETSYDQYFTTPAGHTGITFIASSGDSGTVEYPSASPYVLSVGGTSLVLGSAGAYGSETAWFESGGGYSQYEPEPSYQKSVQTTGQRSTPDVAFDADPNTGVAVYETPPGSSNGSWQVVGGTSLGAPSWAGIIAIVDQGRALAGKGSLDGPTQTLPSLYALSSTAFHAVSASPLGGGRFGPVFVFSGFGLTVPNWYWGGFGFGPGSGEGSSGSGSSGGTSSGANTSTGLGSPNGPSLVSSLVASTTTTPLTTTTGSGQSGSGSAPTTPPSGSGSKRHHAARHSAKATKAKAHVTTVHGRKVVVQVSAPLSRRPGWR